MSELGEKVEESVARLLGRRFRFYKNKKKKLKSRIWERLLRRQKRVRKSQKKGRSRINARMNLVKMVENLYWQKTTTGESILGGTGGARPLLGEGSKGRASVARKKGAFELNGKKGRTGVTGGGRVAI